MIIKPKGNFTKEIEKFICGKLDAMNSKKLQAVIDECNSLTKQNCSWIRYDLRKIVRDLAAHFCVHGYAEGTCIHGTCINYKT